MLAFKAASRKDSPQPMESRPATHLRLFQAHGGSSRNDSPRDEVGQQTYRLESLIGHVNNHPPGIFIPVLRISSILIPLLPIRVARASMSLGLRQISRPLFKSSLQIYNLQTALLRSAALSQTYIGNLISKSSMATTSSIKTLKSLPGFGKPVNWTPERESIHYREQFENALDGSYYAK